MTGQVMKQLGDYEVVRELGHGGMGQVFLVRNVISDRIEAMKVLLPDLAQQGELANRFMREIKVLASLEHPNIAQLRTAFTAENQLVMIMEYVEGETLAQRLEQGAFPSDDALNYIGQVLSALSYAHAKGIIHRDIKPANMMLTPQGLVKLMDFGIARSTADVGMTATGTTLGSFDYMSPEQVKCESTDARSDLYSLGVSLYEMVTGHRMFSATSSYSVMEAHVKETPRPPIKVQPSLPKALSEIIMISVAKDPAQRFQTAEAFRNALSQVGSFTSAGAPSQPVVAATPVPRAVTPPPVAAAPATPVPAPVPQMQPTGGGRHVGWMLAAAIVVLVAIFGGTEVYRSHKQNSVLQSPAAAPAAVNPAATTAPAPSTAATPEPAVSPSTAAPANAPPPEHAAAPKSTPPASVAPPPPSGPTPEEIAAQKKLLDEMETETEQLDGRAEAVESSLATLENDMHGGGLGLRGDIVSARSYMRTDLAKAKQALQATDTDAARKYLDQASRQIEKLEDFVGRR